MPLSAPVGFLYWYTTSIILALLTLYNILTRLHRYFTPAKRCAPPTFTMLPPSVTNVSSAPGSIRELLEEGGPAWRKLGFFSRSRRVLRVVTEKYITLTSLSLPRLWSRTQRKPASSIQTIQLAWNVGYTVGVLVLSFWGSECRLSDAFIHGD